MRKLKSRKFWMAILVIMYGVIMGIRSLNMDSPVTTIACVAAAAVAGVAYVIAEALVDSSHENTGTGEVSGGDGI